MGLGLGLGFGCFVSGFGFRIQKPLGRGVPGIWSKEAASLSFASDLRWMRRYLFNTFRTVGCHKLRVRISGIFRI